MELSEAAFIQFEDSDKYNANAGHIFPCGAVRVLWGFPEGIKILMAEPRCEVVLLLVLTQKWQKIYSGHL